MKTHHVLLLNLTPGTLQIPHMMQENVHIKVALIIVAAMEITTA